MTENAADTEAVKHLARQALAGQRLFYAIYHHPAGADLITAAAKSNGFTDAYVAATGVFIRDQWPEGDVHFNPRPDKEDGDD